MSVDSSTPSVEPPAGAARGPAFEPLPAEALRVWRLGVVPPVLIVVGLLAAADLGLRSVDDVDLPWPPLLPAAVVGVVLAGLGLWWAQRVFRAWRYVLEPDRLVVEHGVITTRSAVLPRSRVQHVSSERGPLQRWLGLVTLTVHTAGARTPNISIPNLRTDTADALRRELVDSRT